MKLDHSAIIIGLFLPLLFWTGSVIAITMMGYPGVVCMTPVAWVLALPVGLRVWQESHSPVGTRRAEAALAGAVLGLVQGGLVAFTMAITPYVADRYTGDLPNPILVSLVAAAISAPVTAGLAAGVVWLRDQRAKREG